MSVRRLTRMNNALLVRFGGLGDLLVTLPAIRFIRAKFPEAKLTLICREQYGRLYLEAGIVDEIIPEDSRRLLPLFEAEASSGGDSAAWLASFDSVIAWTQENPESYLLKAPGFRGGKARPWIIQADPLGKEPLSRVFFRNTVKATGQTVVPPAEEWSRLPLKSFSNDTELKTVVHPGSGSETKRWPLRNFLKMIEELAERGMGGAVVTGEAEDNLADEIEKAGLPPNWKWVRCPSILSLAGLLSGAAFYLGNDSGVTHLAAACGATVVALFRNENASIWRPLGRVHLLSAASLSEISLESVKKIFFHERAQK